jgi:hypothetical protein
MSVLLRQNSREELTVEKTVLAYFKSPEDAEAVSAKLKALKVVDMQIDRISRYPGDPVDETMNPLIGNFTGLGGLVMDGDETSSSAGILMAVDPSASGMSDGGQGGPTGRDILLTAIVEEEIHEKVLRLVADHGGMV